MGESTGHERESGRDAEDAVDELTLGHGITLGDPADLTFADCMHRLVTFDRPTCALCRTEP